MVFNSALCFLLIAIALAGGRQDSSSGRAIQGVLGIVVFVFSAAIFSQYLTGADLGLDWAGSRQRTPDDPFPGRIPAPSALGFMLCGALLVGMLRVRTLWGGLTVQALTVLVMGVGAIGITGHIIPLSLFYRDYLFGHTSLSSAFGFIIAGVVMWRNWRRAPWYASRRLTLRDDRRIALIGVFALGGAVCVSMLAGFAVMVNDVRRLAETAQMELLRSNVNLVLSTIDSHVDRVVLVTDRPVLRQDLHHLNADGRDAAVLQRLRLSFKALGSYEFSGIEVADAKGRVWASEGSFLPDSAMAVALTSKLPVVLAWQEGIILRTTVPIEFEGNVVATVRIEQRLPDLTAFMGSNYQPQDSGELGLCGRKADTFVCFPQRVIPRPYTVPYSAQLPMGHALAGKTGILVGRDYRNENVVAAYGPVGDLGLGMVVKADAAELFLPLRQDMYTLLMIMLLIAAAGGWALYGSVHPLVQRLESSESRLQQALEGSRIALWDWDLKTGTVYLSERWAEMLGEPPFSMTVQMDKLQAMVHPEDLPTMIENLQLVLKGKETAYDLEYRIVLRDGRERWIRSRGKVAARDAAGRVLRMVGTNVDIGRRKEAELLLAHQASHDALTGLPNRMFFKDRLGQAMARARRQGAPMAVMYMDIDRFKGINDTLGHEAGDVLLREFAKRISGVLRTTDTAVRLGGDEFVLILESVGGREEAERVAAKVATAMQPPFSLGKGNLRITISGGLALYDGKTGLDSDELLRKADEALYEAKAAGRNNIKIAE